MGLNIGSSRDRVIGSSEFRDDHRVRPPAIELHIEELVLHGFQPSDRRRIGDAVQRELARLLTERGLSALGAAPMNIDRIDAGDFKVAAGARPRVIGAQLAHTLHSSLASPKKTETKRATGRQTSR